MGGAQIAPSNIIDRGGGASDRLALIELAIATHAPDAALTEADIAQAETHARFRRRETPRNQRRQPGARAAYEVASCLVQDQPVLTTRLVRATPGSALEQGLVQAILIDGRGCLGGLKRLTVNPISLRMYLVDAFYRWVIAARGVDSLIPAEG